MEDSDFQNELRNSEKTQALTSAINALKKRDFTRLMGSGVIVTMRLLNGSLVTEPFMIRAEDVESFKGEIIDSLEESLRMRVCLLELELKTIRDSLPEGK
jgi:hypothetical protein